MLTTEEWHPAMTVTVDDFPDLDPAQALDRVRAHNIEWYRALIAAADAEAAEKERRSQVYYLDDVAAVLGLDSETADKFRKVSIAEGGMGPRGLPVQDGYDRGRGRYQERPWWYPETIVWWGTAVGLLNPHTGQPQRLPQANKPHPPRPTVAAPDPELFQRLVGASHRWYLADVALRSGHLLSTVRSRFRHTSIVEGGMGPVGMPVPDGYRTPYNDGHLPQPWWRAGTVRWWLIATGRLNPYTGAPQRMVQTFATHPWRPTVTAPDLST